MQAVSQAVGNPEAHFAIMTGERYITLTVKVQESQDPILIHSVGSSSGNYRNGLGHGVTKSFVFQGVEYSATAFKVDLTRILACRNKKVKIPYTELLKAKNPADIEAL